jgi:hypothetical protein
MGGLCNLYMSMSMNTAQPESQQPRVTVPEQELPARAPRQVCISMNPTRPRQLPQPPCNVTHCMRLRGYVHKLACLANPRGHCA